VQTHDAAPPALSADAGKAPHADHAADPWQLVRRGHDRTGFAQDESLFALANGSLGVRGGLEEDDSPSQGCFLAGVWERSTIAYHERFTGYARATDTRVPVADASRIRLRLGDTPVRLDAGEWLALNAGSTCAKAATGARCAGARRAAARWKSPRSGWRRWTAPACWRSATACAHSTTAARSRWNRRSTPPARRSAKATTRASARI